MKPYSSTVYGAIVKFPPECDEELDMSSIFESRELVKEYIRNFTAKYGDYHCGLQRIVKIKIQELQPRGPLSEREKQRRKEVRGRERNRMHGGYFKKIGE